MCSQEAKAIAAPHNVMDELTQVCYCFTIFLDLVRMRMLELLNILNPIVGQGDGTAKNNP